MIWGQIVLKAFTNLVLMLVFLVLDLGVWLEGRFLHGCCCSLCSCAQRSPWVSLSCVRRLVGTVVDKGCSRGLVL